MSPNPFQRTSFWTLTIGMTTAWIAKLGVSQCCIQRFLAVPNIEVAKKSVWVFAFGLGALKLGAILLGLIIYTKYESCDPVSTKQIEKPDQIVPLFVMDVASKIPGLPGLFIAGIFSAALSSISSILNTKAGIIYEDFIRDRLPGASEKRASDIMKILVVILGVIMLSLVFVVEHLGSIFRLNYAINGLTIGAFFGIFSIGMMSRTANTKGVMCGAAGSLIVVGIIIIGAQTLPKPLRLPVRTDECEYPFNMTDTTRMMNEHMTIEDIPIIFRLSFMYYALLGTIILFLIALPVSWATGGCPPFDERLLTPLLRSKMWKEKNENDKTVDLNGRLELDDLKKLQLKKFLKNLKKKSFLKSQVFSSLLKIRERELLKLNEKKGFK
jgi:solute carrier family 5 (sodium-coupled monocarboxylate transporter), member 8/12